MQLKQGSSKHGKANKKFTSTYVCCEICEPIQLPILDQGKRTLVTAVIILESGITLDMQNIIFPEIS